MFISLLFFFMFVCLHLQNNALIYYTLHSSCRKKIDEKTRTFPIYYLSYLCAKFLTESNFRKERLILAHILRSHLWWDEVAVEHFSTHSHEAGRNEYQCSTYFFFLFIQFEIAAHKIVLPTFNISLPISVTQRLRVQMLRDLLGDPKYN